MTIRKDNLIAGDFPRLTDGIFLEVDARIYLRGDALGRVDKSVPTTGTAGGGNTGNGTMINVEGKSNTLTGTYTAICTAIAANGGTFSFQDPNSSFLPDITVGTTYDNQHMTLDIVDSTTDFALGDSFTIAVVVGSKQYKLADSAAVDGSEVVRLILNDISVDATAIAQAADGYKTGSFNESEINFGGTDSIEDHRDAMWQKSLFTALNEK